MCDFIPLICVWGCPTKIEQDASGPAMICPRCHNASVHNAKSRMWFEFCFVPIIPCQSEQIYFCSICSWEVNRQGNPAPPIAPGPGQQYQQLQPGYQPAPNPNQGWGGQAPYGGYGAQPYPQQQPPKNQQGGFAQPYPPQQGYGN
ncbi:hypothetical protein DACRYDRAFT_68581 [Dacryopinax primogenitus]|uniref:Zinc-ribbon 15 domain-containing protein n=1 Tax=Dacryopinax primogenitus (strain DJM 731) TaxID=1858805 RepID=M5G3F0_DACPD|nr:uncharacterized protein DACRYDRAFT_68581 [Dacryopinax primogenitus]EJU00402.1 hypothetical protein DACRYDRAFT_68581 [Dacryopinax primogenitus]